MAYIGRDISSVSDRVVLDNITASATATYNLLINSVAYVPSSAESLTVSLNGIIQKPQSSYTVSGGTIVFASTLSASDSIDFILAERAITLTTVGSGSVGLNQLSATGTKDATTFLRGDNTFASIETRIAWQSSIKTSSFTAVANEGYWIDTSSNTVTITFPSSASVGDTIELVDYARTWGTNKIIIDSNGLNYQGQADTSTVEYDTSGQALRVVYSGATKGWIPTSDEVSENNPVIPTYSINFLAIAGAGGGGAYAGGGGGAGGYRNSYNNETSGGGGSSESALTLTLGTQYTVTVGAGGSGATVNGGNGSNGANSSISGSGLTTITSTAGGGGHHSAAGATGGSGGGGGYASGAGGAGTSGQGSNGGTGGSSGGPHYPSAGGGGAGAVGGNGGSTTGGVGGNGLASSITGSAVTRAGGGGGSGNGNAAGGSGGGGQGSPAFTPGRTNGTANTGSGGGGGNDTDKGNGGSGIVILRMATSDYSSTTTGSPSVTTSGSDTILTFTGSGSYTA